MKQIVTGQDAIGIRKRLEEIISLGGHIDTVFSIGDGTYCIIVYTPSE